MIPAGAPLPGAVWQYVVQRAGTGEILERDAQIRRTGMSWALSAAGDATFTADAQDYTQPAQDGRDTFGKWDTVIVAIASGKVRHRLIVTDVDPSPDGILTITCDSMSTYPHGIPWLGPAFYGAEVDPGDIMRMIWAHVQSYANAKLGVTVSGSTGQKVGTYSTQDADDAAKAYTAATKAYTDAVADRKDAQADETAARKVYSDRVAAVTAASKNLTAAKKIKPKNTSAIATAQAAYNAAVASRDAQKTVVAQKAAATDAKAAIVKQKQTAKSTAYDLKVATNKKKKADGGAYTLLWWELPDCGESIDTLASDYGFDWVESSAWNADKSGFTTTITLMYPRAGTKRTDLVFSDSVNMSEPVTAKDNGDDYANSIVGIGAGEGAASVRAETSTTDGGRLRRVKTVSAKDAKTTTALEKRIRPALNVALSTFAFDSIKVVDHPNARIGSWNVGDDIRVDAYIPHLGNVKIWHRIVGYSIDDDAGTTATITLKRSSTYTYGG